MPRVREYSFTIIMSMEFQNQLVSTRVSAVPVAPDSEGTDSNPFTLDALAVFIIRVLQRENHPVFIFLLVFWHFYNAFNEEARSPFVKKTVTIIHPGEVYDSSVISVKHYFLVLKGTLTSVFMLNVDGYTIHSQPMCLSSLVVIHFSGQPNQEATTEHEDCCYAYRQS